MVAAAKPAASNSSGFANTAEPALPPAALTVGYRPGQCTNSFTKIAICSAYITASCHCSRRMSPLSAVSTRSTSALVATPPPSASANASAVASAPSGVNPPLSRRARASDAEGELTRNEHGVPQRGTSKVQVPTGNNQRQRILPQGSGVCQRKRKNGGWLEVPIRRFLRRYE